VKGRSTHPGVRHVRTRRGKGWALATLSLLLAILFLALGIWQVERRTGKLALIEASSIASTRRPSLPRRPRRGARSPRRATHTGTLLSAAVSSTTAGRSSRP
jgi:cytochrome oxidase assembly protein ShyY1